MKSLLVGSALMLLSCTAAFAQTANANSQSNSLAQGVSMGNTTSFNSTSALQAPGAYAPGLAAAGIEVCTGSASAGISGPGFGIAFGSTKTEQGCEARLDARTLFSMGHKAAANFRLCTEPNMAMAFAYAGTPCPAEFYSRSQQRAIGQNLAIPVPASSQPMAVRTRATAPVAANDNPRYYDPDLNRWLVRE